MVLSGLKFDKPKKIKLMTIDDKKIKVQLDIDDKKI